jgi:DNA-binding transcriptional LysR family regulator
LRAPALREVLALTTTPGLAAFWLIPRLPAFTRAHPGIDVRLDASFELRNLAAEGFDLAIRYGRSGVVQGQPLFGESALPVASPALLRRLPLKRLDDLRRHTLLQLEPNVTGGATVEWEPWLQGAGMGALQPVSRLSFSSYGDVVAAALAGQGVALGRRPLVDALLRRRELVAPLGDGRATQRAYALVVDPAARARPAVRALEAWLLDEAARERAAAPTALRPGLSAARDGAPTRRRARPQP